MSTPGNGLNDLPPELLCNIFQLTIDKFDAPKKERCRLMLVCRQWREYVEDSALLWTDSSALDSLTYVRRALERSKEAMLDLRFWVCGRSYVELEAFMVEAGPHVARWRSVTMRFGSAPSLEGALGQLTTTQAPSLESLTVYVATSGHLISGNTITLFGGAPAPPTLKVLMLDNIPVAIEPLNLSDLVSLHLAGLSTISTPQLLEILRRSPWLRTLGLNNNPALVAIGSRTSNVQPIELPKLDSLSIRWIDLSGANSILPSIRIPDRSRVYIRGDVGTVSARSVLFTSAITRLLHRTTPTTDIPSLTIKVHQYSDVDRTITFRGLELELFVDGENCIQEVLPWLADGLGWEAVDYPVHLTLEWSESNSLPLTTVPPPWSSNTSRS